MSLPPLKVNIGADTTGLVDGVDKANSKLGGMTGTAQRVGKSIDNISSRAKALGAAMTKITGAIAAAAGGLVAITKASADNANQIGKAARTAGLGAEAFQELQFAVGQMADVSDGQFADAMQKLTRRTGLAAQGNKSYADAMDRIGVTQDELISGTITTEEMFGRLSDAMSRMESDAEAAAVASQLLGERQGPKIAAAMRANAEALDEGRKKARELGLIMSGDFVRNSEKMVDQFDVLSRQTEKLRADLAEKVIPVLVDTLIPAIQNKVIPAIGRLIDKIGDVVSWFQDLPGPVQDALGLIATALAAGGPVMLALGAFLGVLKAALLATGPIGLFIAAAALAVAAWQKWGDDIKAAVGGAIDWISGKFDAFMAKIQAIIDRAVAVKDAIAGALSLGGGAEGRGSSSRGGPAAQMQGTESEAARGNIEGREIANGIVQGVDEGLQENEGWLRGVINRIPGMAREELEIESPSKVFDRIGRHIGQGLSGGIESTVGLSQRAMDMHSKGMTQSAENATQSILGSMNQLFDKSKPIAAAQALVNTYLGITEALKLPFPASLAAAAKVAAQGFAAVSGIRSANKGGGGAGASSGAGGSSAQPQVQTQRVDLNIIGGNDRDRMVAREVINTLNNAQRDGFRLDPRLIGA